MATDEWVRLTTEIIKDKQRERMRVEQRIASARLELDRIDDDLRSLQKALDLFSEKHGLTRDDVTDVDEEVARVYRGKSVKEMLVEWANRHNGTLRNAGCLPVLCGSRLVYRP